MEKSIVILKGSPRENGNSAVLADQAALGARSAGASVEIFYLHGMDIRACDACDLCQESGNGCVIADDMQSIYPSLEQADAILIASPIYWFNFSAQTKLCIDRWYAFEKPGGNALTGKRFGLLLSYGDDDPYASGGMNALHSFQDILRYLKAELVGVVHASASDAGEIRQQAEVLAGAFHLGEALAV